MLRRHVLGRPISQKRLTFFIHNVEKIKEKYEDDTMNKIVLSKVLEIMKAFTE